jgi:hypothetical protein
MKKHKVFYAYLFALLCLAFVPIKTSAQFVGNFTGNFGYENTAGVNLFDGTFVQVFSGDTVIIIAEISDAADFPANPTFRVQLLNDGRFLNAEWLNQAVWDVDNEVALQVVIPRDSKFWNNGDGTPYFRIYAINGTSFDEGEASINRSYLTNQNFFTQVGGVYNGTTRIDFNGDLSRSVTTEPINFHNTNNATLSLDLMRLTQVLPPAELDLVLEYTKNGSTWTKLKDIPLGGDDADALRFNDWITISFDDNDANFVNSASAQTQYRVRQLGNPGGELFTWGIRNFVVYVEGTGTNYKSISTNNLFINRPVIDFELNADFAPDVLDSLYPGRLTRFDFSREFGYFPAGTNYYVINGADTLRTLTSIQNFTMALPWRYNGGGVTFDLRAVEPEGESVSVVVNLNMLPVRTEVTNHTTDFTDSNVDWNIPGRSITASYIIHDDGAAVDANGIIRTGSPAANVALQIWHSSGWITIKSQPLTNGVIGLGTGTIEGVIPPQMTAYNETTNIRVIVEEYNTTGFASNRTVRMVHPTLSIEALPNFTYGETVDIQYDAFPFDPGADSIYFAIALKNGNNTLVIAESNALGDTAFNNVTLPTADELLAAGFISDVDDNFVGQLWAYAYYKTLNPFNLLLSSLVQSHATWLETSANRFYITRDFDLTNQPSPVVLKFDYSVTSNISHRNQLTLPRLEVSTDNGLTYTTIKVENSAYADINRLPADIGLTTFKVELAPAFLTSKTHFRWIRDVNETGTWSVSNVEVLSGNSNLVDFHVTYVPASQFRAINISHEATVDPYADFTNINGYSWEFYDDNIDTDLDPVAVVGQVADYKWNMELDIDGEPVHVVWPTGTIFQFTMDVTDPETGDDYILATTTDTGAFNFTLPDFITTGFYSVYAQARIEDGDGTLLHSSATVYQDQILVVNETTPDHLHLTFLGITPEDDNDEYHFGQQITIKYDQYGPWPADVKLLPVLRLMDGGNVLERHTLTVDAAASTPGNLVVTLPSFVKKQNSSDEFKIQMYAHTGENIILADYELALEEDQMLIVEGHDYYGNDYYFYKEGKRQALTNALDLSGLDPATAELNFWYWANNITENPATLPRLSVSVDGGATFTPLANELSAFGAMGYLPGNGGSQYVSIKLDPAFITAATHFKWEQGINRDEYADDWEIWNLYVNSGINNVFGNYGVTDFPKTVNMVIPSIAVDYVFEITRDADGFEPVIYPGNAVAFTWGLTTDVDGNVIGKEFPAGSQFEYFIQGYPTWSDYYPVEFTLVDAATNAYTMTLPEDIKRNDYSLVASVSVDGIYFEEHTWIGSLKVYNHLVVTVYNEEAPVLFAGNNASFTAQLESALPGNTFDNVYFNLILRDNSGNDWLLAVNQGLANNFDVALPPFVNGNRNFRVEASLNAPMGVVGSILESAGNVNNLGINALISDVEGSRTFESTGEIDMLDDNFISFQVKISESLANLTEDQKLVFEYSVNEGFTYTTLATYPDARFNDEQYFENQDLTDWFNETIELPAAANTEKTVLRWRIEENKAGNNVAIRNVELKPYPANFIAAPFISINKNVNIVEQRVDITTTNDASYCNEDVIEFAYNIRGRFGARTKLALEDYNGNELAVLEGITEGSGTMQVELDGNLSGSAVKFRVVASDKTVADYNYTVNGALNDYGVEIIAQVDQNSNLNADGTTCATAERVLTITGAQTNFVYQLRDLFTQALIGDEVVVNLEDENLMNADTYPYFDGANLMIFLGQISNKVTVEAVVTPQSKNRDKACDVKVINNRATFESRPNYTMHVTNQFTNNTEIPYNGSEMRVCGNDVNLVMGYYDSEGTFNNVSADWYRGDMTMPLGYTTDFDGFVISGNYFAVVNDGACGIYQSEMVSIVKTTQPEQPAINAAASTIACDGEAITLNGTQGFAYYQWSKDGEAVGNNSFTISVTETGTYTLVVSNEPFTTTTCASNQSNPVAVFVTNFNNIAAVTPEITLCSEGDNTAVITFNNTEHAVTYQLVDLASGANFGQAFSSTSGTATITTPALTGNDYGVMATSDLNAACSKLLATRVVVNTLPQYQTLIRRDNVYELALDQNGNPTTFTGCDGDMTLGLGEANGTLVSWGSDVKWYKDGMFIAAGRELAATESGVYAAVYTNDNTNNGVCQYSSVATTLVIGAKPTRPVVTPSGALEFCEGASDLILTAPTAASYRWTRDNANINNVSSSDNTLSVTASGDYRVTVADAIGCESEPSIAISATVHQLPKMEDFNVLSPVLCEANIAQVQIPNAEYDVMYQLFNVVTGENTGAARMGLNNLVISSDELTENGTFGIRAYRLNADACDVTFAETFKVKVYNLEVKASGNMLIASVADAVSYQWYRNGIAVVNGGNKSTLLIYDNASYSVKVVTADGCTLDSSVGGGKDGEERPTNTTTLDVYPNPSSTSTTLLIAGAASGDIRVRVVNPSGGVVYEQVINKQTAEVKHEIPVYQLTPGVYVIQAVGQNYIETKQFIKF